MTSAEDLTHRWRNRWGRAITFTWMGDADLVSSRVHGLAYAPGGGMLLVGGGPRDPDYWLPGGAIEEGETAEEALA